jgi:hypothetical protein
MFFLNLQLFTPASPKDGAGTSRLYVSDTEGWPKHMHLKFEHFEHEMPFNRTPLYEHIEMLAIADCQRKLQRQQQQQDSKAESLETIEASSQSSPCAVNQTGCSAKEIKDISCKSKDDIPVEPDSTVKSSSSTAASSQPPGSFLREARIAELHPASWFSVAW